MSTLRRLARPVDASLRTITGRYSRRLENLIHAIKSEIVGRLDQMEKTTESAHTGLRDQLALQGVAIRKLTQLAEETRADASALRAQILTAKGEIDLSPRAHRATRDEVYGARAELIEHPFVFAALADLAPGSRILDVGGGESTLAVALASSGFQVTVVEPMGYPFTHPNLSVFEKPLEQFEAVEPFDAVVALSSTKHVGIAAYDTSSDHDLDADAKAITSIAHLLGPGGRLVLTTPFGPAEVTDVERIYDNEQLGQLLAGWTVHHAAIGRRLDDRTWELETNQLAEPEGPDRVAMLIATPPARS
jgi:SAM-dependent methyltransferase